MMETFLVLGLCFILYEALDFFQGCMHSAQPSASDQIDAYRRQLDEQRQQHQQEQILANLTPLLTQHHHRTPPQLNTPSTTASIISELRQQQLLRELQAVSSASILNSSNASNSSSNNNSNSNNNLNHSNAYEVESVAPSAAPFHSGSYLHSTASLPRDYYYLQQQQLKNKSTAKSLLSKLTSSSDNRIFPSESTRGVGVPAAPAGVITTQPGLSSFSDCPPPFITPPADSLALDLKRAILSNTFQNNNNNSNSNTSISNNNNNNNNNNGKANSNNDLSLSRSSLHSHAVATVAEEAEDADDNDDDDDEEDSSTSSGASSSSASAGSASLASCSDNDEEEEDDYNVNDNENVIVVLSNHKELKSQKKKENLIGATVAAVGDDDVVQLVGVAGSGAVTSADYREIECERLRRKCVNVKRIYSISEKF